VPLWVESVTSSTAQPSPSGRSCFCSPGKNGAICAKVLSWLKYWIFGAKAGGSLTTSFSRKIERSTNLRAMDALLRLLQRS
jgi:hypothetical protein